MMPLPEEKYFGLLDKAQFCGWEYRRRQIIGSLKHRN